MKQIITLILVCAALSGCHTTKTIPQIVEHTVHDTLYMNRLQYDSIYIDNWQLIEQRSDTVFIEKAKMEYKYKFLRDTVRIHQVDTIPVIKEVEIVREVKYVPFWNKLLTWIGLATIAFIFVKIAQFVINLKKL